MKNRARPSRLAPLIAVGALLPLVVFATPAASASQDVGWLRLAHLSPNTPPVDVYLYSFGNPTARVVLHHVAYGTVSPYLTVASGRYTVAMRGVGAAANSPPVLSTSVLVLPDCAYTVAGMGPAKGLRLRVFPDRLSAPPGRTEIRVIQASLQQHLVTVGMTSGILSRKQPFATITSYLAVRPGQYDIWAAGTSEKGSQAISLVADTVHTLVVLDDAGHLKIANLEDAAGSRVRPAGGAATGFGGTAPRPAPSPVPWLITAIAGLLLTAGCVGWLRRGAGVAPRHRITGQSRG